MTVKPTYEELEQKVKQLESEEFVHQKSVERLLLFQTVVETSNEAIAISDANGQLVYINSAHEQLFGRSLEEARKLNYRDYYPPESIAVLNAGPRWSSTSWPIPGLNSATASAPRAPKDITRITTSMNHETMFSTAMRRIGGVSGRRRAHA